MPVDLSVDVKRHLVLVTGYETVTGAELFTVDSELRASPTARPEFNELLDYTRVTAQAVTAKDLVALSDRPPYFAPTSKRAVAGKGQLMYGNMRMFELLRNDSAGQWRFFENRKDAEAWLMAAEECSDSPPALSPDTSTGTVSR